MSLLLRRGLEKDRTSITFAEGEMIYITDTKKVYIGDGRTAGGILMGGGFSNPVTTQAPTPPSPPSPPGPPSPPSPPSPPTPPGPPSPPAGGGAGYYYNGSTCIYSTGFAMVGWSGPYGSESACFNAHPVTTPPPTTTMDPVTAALLAAQEADRDRVRAQFRYWYAVEVLHTDPATFDGVIVTNPGENSAWPQYWYDHFGPGATPSPPPATTTAPATTSAPTTTTAPATTLEPTTTQPPTTPEPTFPPYDGGGGGGGGGSE